MNTQQIDLEETIGKVVGRRKPPAAAEAVRGLQETGVLLSARWVNGMPRGVYRYRSHEEAEQDLMRHTVQRG